MTLFSTYGDVCDRETVQVSGTKKNVCLVLGEAEEEEDRGNKARILSSSAATGGAGIGTGRGFWWGPGTKAPVSSYAHTCARKQTSRFSLSLSELRLLGLGEKLVSKAKGPAQCLVLSG